MLTRRTTARGLAQIAVFAALIAALGLPGMFTLGSLPIPITLQTLGVMLAGGLLGPRIGTMAVATFQVLVLAGLPLLAGGRGGMVVLSSPSAGYFVGWLPAALVIGLLTWRVLPKYPLWLGVLINIAGGMLVIYLVGIPWAAVRADVPIWAALADAGKFVPGDALKAVVAALVIKQVHRAYPVLVRRSVEPARRKETSNAPGR